MSLHGGSLWYSVVAPACPCPRSALPDAQVGGIERAEAIRRFGPTVAATGIHPHLAVQSDGTGQPLDAAGEATLQGKTFPKSWGITAVDIVRTAHHIPRRYSRLPPDSHMLIVAQRHCERCHRVNL